MRLSDLHLSNTVTLKLITSGYDDRYVSHTAHYRARLLDPALDAARRAHPDQQHAALEHVGFEWTDQKVAVDTLMLLTSQSWEECYAFVRNCETKSVSSWWVNPNHSRSGPVRAQVLDAIGKLATHQHRERATGRGNFTTDAVAGFIETMRGATADELACTAWWLAECNRTNGLNDRLPVAFPTYQAPAAA